MVEALPLPGSLGTNGQAIASLVMGVTGVIWFGIGWLLAIAFGHQALRQIRDSRGAQFGEGLAVAGLVLGYVGLISSLLLLIVFVNS
jgi:hypothetical protein